MFWEKVSFYTKCWSFLRGKAKHFDDVETLWQYHNGTFQFLILEKSYFAMQFYKYIPVKEYD